MKGKLKMNLKTSTKIIALLLIIAMCLGLGNFKVFAEEGDDDIVAPQNETTSIDAGDETRDGNETTTTEPQTETLPTTGSDERDTPVEATNVKEMALQQYYTEETKALEFTNETGKIELSENIIKTASLIYDNWKFKPTLTDYDFATGVYITVVLTKDTTENAKLTLPVPNDYNNTTVRFVVGGKTYSAKASNGAVVFENVPITDYETCKSIDGAIYFSKSLTSETGSTLGTTSEAAVETTIKTEKELPAGAKLSVKEVEIPKALKKAKKDLKKIFDISVLDANSEIIPISDNKMSITITLDEDLKGYNTYKVVYIKDGKIIEEMDATVKNGKLTFITDHLSEYGIVAYNSSEKDGTPKTGNNAIVYVGILAVLTLGSVVIINKKARH